MTTTLYWTMKNGRQINIDDMSEEHLRNTLKMIVRSSQQKTSSPTPKTIGNIESNFMEDQFKEWEDDEFYEN